MNFLNSFYLHHTWNGEDWLCDFLFLNIYITWFSSCWKCWWTILEIVFTSRWLIQELFLFLWKLWRKKWVFLHTDYCSLAKLFFIFSLIVSLSLFFPWHAVRFACKGADISPIRCHTNIPWWCFWKVSTVL